MLISRVPVYVLLLIIIKDITGFEKDNPISDDEDYSDANSGSGQSTIMNNDNCDDEDITGFEKDIPKSDDEDYSDAYSGSGQSTIMNNDNCDDAYSNYSDCSFHHELIGLASNEMIIITNDVLLQSIVPLLGLENITIIGNDNPTVNCDNDGGIYFDHSQNFTIIGITWEKCGNKNDNSPAIKLYNSSNIIIQNCSFQNSVTQSIALSEMSGNVTINGCTFAFNNYYEDHGVAIHYLSKIQQHSTLQLTISNCNFTHNGVVNSSSVVFIGPSHNKITENILFTNSVFLNNHGTPIYISHQNVLIVGNMLFKRNVAKKGGGIFINNHAKVTFHRLNAKFINNKALYGGALCLAKCSNCLFKGMSIVTINNNTAINNGGAVYIEDNSDITFEGNSKIIISNNQADYGGAICALINSNLKSESNSTVIINNNNATDGGAIYINDNSDFTFEGNTTVTLNNNTASDEGGAVYIEENSDITFEENCKVTISNSQADFGGAISIFANSSLTFKGSSTVTINNNAAIFSGGAVKFSFNSDVIFEGNCKVTISNNQAYYYGGGILIVNSNLTFKGSSTVTINNNAAGNIGGAVFKFNSDVTFEGNCKVIISNNKAFYGGAISIWVNTNLTFKGSSTVTINNNVAIFGGAIGIGTNSDITFEGNCKVTINSNQAEYGGAIYFQVDSNLKFNGSSTVMINENKAKSGGGAINIESLCTITFGGNSKIKINNNQANSTVAITSSDNPYYHCGGAIHIEGNSYITFEGHSKVTISNNVANCGGALFILRNSDLKFKGSSTVTIYNNQANHLAGAIYISLKSHLKSEENSTVIINNNNAKTKGGAVYIYDKSDFTFKGNSTLTIYNNQADYGGGIYITYKSVLKFNEMSTIKINSNQAKHWSGAIDISFKSNIAFEGNSAITINNNQADYGGALSIKNNSYVTSEGNSTIIINNNNATYYGGAVYIWTNSDVTFEGNSVVTINNNQANEGGAFSISHNSDVTIKGNSISTINKNQANEGGAVYIWDNSAAIFEGNSTVTINNNIASYDGGAFNIGYNSDVTCKGNTTVAINNNQANNGGAMHTQLMSSTIFNGNSVVTFDNNAATADGGALNANNNCSVKVKGNSTIIFNNNQASVDGGAIYFNNQINVLLQNSSTVTLSSNTADNNGGGIYSTITQTTRYFNISEIKYSDNRAGVAGNLLYIEVPKSCNASCLTDSTIGINNDILWHSLSNRLIATSPNTLTLHYPAKCISNDSVGCEKYYIDNIMLGQEIAIPACLLDYYNRPAEVTQFTIIGGNHQNYYVYGSQYILISCNHSLEGISIIGNQTIISSLNYSTFLTSQVSSKSIRKTIVMKLTVELSPCHPGFLYHSKSLKCECYNNSGIVYCSGSSSAIKSGYWFGHVTGIPTVTFCPISYCNFTCCMTTNGYHQLSPTRNNQCRLHRAGIACGSCENGYTLPYHSSECVNINKCTITWTILITILTVLYWVAIVTVISIMMHYQINIGKLYVITYYYSIMDALLSDNLEDLSDGVYTFINIMYSIAKLTPQFLGKFCLVKGISGIDQQFIHYIHPLVVAFILIVINLLARCSLRLSSLLSRAIIRVICVLLLLSYTSVTTTSLLLLKYLKFSDVTKIYTHLSPDTEYFHGRHLAYGIIALLCMIIVVIGLPLLLLLEPFINHKINFTKIKPILDQFQGCYKDKYRWFAAYYMICRLVIISIIIVFTSNDFTARYLLITVCAVIVLLHLITKPYNSKTLNIFDTILLLLLVLTTVLLLIDFTESNLAIQVTLLLLMLPLMIVGVMCLLAYRESIKRVLMNLFNKVDDEDSNNNIEMPTRNFDLIIDDSMRKNATVCRM